MKARIFLSLVAVLMTTPAAAQGFAWLQKLAAQADGFRAEFTYTASSAYWDDQQAFSGSLVLQGSRYRIETNAEVILSHGSDTYVYRPLENQVLITSEEPTFSPATLFGDFEQYYRVAETESSTYRGARHHTIRLAPRDPDSPVLEVVLWMRTADGVVTRIQSVDVNETTMDIELAKIELHPRIDPQTFELSFPENAEIIDLRS